MALYIGSILTNWKIIDKKTSIGYFWSPHWVGSLLSSSFEVIPELMGLADSLLMILY
jgi:hypothetical protein